MKYFVGSIILFSIVACKPEIVAEKNMDEHFKNEYRTVSFRDSLADSSRFPERVRCIPNPSDFFIRMLEGEVPKPYQTSRQYRFEIDNVYLYLMYHLDSLDQKHVTKVDDFWGPYEWSQAFENGVYYYHLDYLEVGSSGKLFTKCRDKPTFVQAITPVIKDRYNYPNYDPNYQWNHDSTVYEPLNQAAGCHYQIKRDSLDFLILDWICAC
jgi:hypothetical protein